MSTLITCSETDDSGFISEVNNLLLDKIREFKPHELFITYINNWFDSKWLKFSGTSMHEISVWKQVDVTIPPFNPNRVIFSNKFIQNKNHFVLSSPNGQNLHVVQESSSNFSRKITDVSQNGLFVWYSSNTKKNGKGSVLIYLTNEDKCLTFYFALAAEINSTWSVEKLIEQ
jgi:hypothetical protein